MKPGMKMMMMDRMQRQPENNRSEYGGGNRRMIGYDRDRSGNANTPNYGSENNRYGMEGGSSYSGRYRNEYDEGKYGYGRNEPESRRRRDRRGRYMMDGMDEDEEEYEKHSQVWYPPNMMSGSRYGFGDVYADVYAGGAMNRPTGGMMAMMGGDMSEPVDEHTARKWVQKMDGGEHFRVEQSDQLRNSVCPGCEKWEFYVALNAMHSDHCETMKKLGMDKPEVYAHLAKDFIEDKDAKPNKLRTYMGTIAK